MRRWSRPRPQSFVARPRGMVGSIRPVPASPGVGWNPAGLCLLSLLASAGAGCLPENAVLVDEDRDGAYAQTLGGNDCDDTNPAIFPGAAETCDGLDNNCDGATDEGFADGDGDGLPDCRDNEDCDGVDNDGDGRIDEGAPDTDRDGVPDCRDAEQCDGLDNDGDGLVDEDFDGDGLGGSDCQDDDGDGQSELQGDCDDSDPDINDTHEFDQIDGRDSDCDRVVDENTDLSRGSFVLQGEIYADGAGYVVHSAGDMDGDGYPDLLVSARGASSSTVSDCGRVYYLRGGSGFFRTGALEDADALWQGTQNDEHVGQSIAALGDINGDGYDDVLVGTIDGDYGSLASSGRVYLVMGRAGGFSGIHDLPTLSAALFAGRASSDLLGTALAGPGDVDADGYPDLLLTSPGADVVYGGTTLYSAGEVYLFRGGASGITGTIPVDAAWATFAGYGASSSLGEALAGLQDVTGDGTADFLIGEPVTSVGGNVYLILGDTRPRGRIRLDGTSGIPFATYSALAAGDELGRALLGPGDLDGDGIADFIMAAPSNAAGGGAVYVYYGGTRLIEGPQSVGDADFILGQSGAGELGRGLGAAGDVDGDGRADVLLTSPLTGPPGSPAAVNFFLLTGARRMGNGKINTLAGASFSGTYLVGLEEVFRTTVWGDDFDGDGASDLALGIPRANNKDDPGSVYLFPGYPVAR